MWRSKEVIMDPHTVDSDDNINVELVEIYMTLNSFCMQLPFCALVFIVSGRVSLLPFKQLYFPIPYKISI